MYFSYDRLSLKQYKAKKNFFEMCLFFLLSTSCFFSFFNLVVHNECIWKIKSYMHMSRIYVIIIYIKNSLLLCNISIHGKQAYFQLTYQRANFVFVCTPKE